MTDLRRLQYFPAVARERGINAFMEVVSRATFAVPPRAMRAYPGRRPAHDTTTAA